MMSDAIKNFAKQFEWNPIIEQGESLVNCQHYVVCGMGGSHLAADLIKNLLPDKPIVIHSDYNLPSQYEFSKQDTLIIISSYSGNTEETISGYHQAQAANLPMLVIACGGELINLAKRDGVPYIQIPDTGIQPRSALGFSLKAMLKAMSEDEMLNESAELAQKLQPVSLEAQGQKLAEAFQGKVPVIYASKSNFALAYNWKIKLNETGKIPAFYNLAPELNHNEMNGFDYLLSNEKLSQNFGFIFLRDKTDNDRINKRFEILKELLNKRELQVHEIWVDGASRLEAIFTCLLIADWLAFHTATLYGAEAEQVPMVEEFKGLMK